MGFLLKINFFKAQLLFWLCFIIYIGGPAFLDPKSVGVGIFILQVFVFGFLLSYQYHLVLVKLKINYTDLKQVLICMSLGMFITIVAFTFFNYVITPSNYLGELKEYKNKEYIYWLAVITNSITTVSPWFLIYHIFMFAKHTYLDQQKAQQIELAYKELQLESLSNKLNPHFLFNSLNTIKWLANKDASDARNAIDKLSAILRYNFEEKGRKCTIADEIGIVEKYLNIEKIRFTERLNYTLNIENGLENQPIIAFIILNLIDNAIKHGISKLPDGGTVMVNIKSVNNNIEIIVQNTGELKTNKAGIGWTSIRTLLESAYGNNTSFATSMPIENVVEIKIKYPKHVI